MSDTPDQQPPSAEPPPEPTPPPAPPPAAEPPPQAHQPPPQPPGAAPGWPQQPGGVQPPPAAAGNGMAVAALVMGIVGVIFAIIPLTIWLAIPLGILAILFGILGRGKAKKEARGGGGMAMAGTITGAIAIVISVLWIALFGALVGGFGEVIDQLEVEFEEFDNEQIEN